MSGKVTDKAVERFLDYAEGKNTDNPFIKDGSTIFLKFDAVQILNSETPNNLNVCLLWKGSSTYIMEVEGIALTLDSCVTLAGVSGKMELTLEAN